LKVWPVCAHDPGVDTRALAAPTASADEDTVNERAERARPDFNTIYERWFHEVSRWIRAFGGPEADLDDLAQEVFLVARRKLGDFDGQNLPGWLYRIAANTVSDHRRRAWFRNLLRRRRDTEWDDLDALEEPRLNPLQSLEQREAQRTVHRLLARMSEKRRTAFVLFEIEGYSGEEIAALQGIPVATVWTRLHHARKEFLAMVEALRATEEE
jgi:RNA polymerase sigma-70 factor (ECF subfamily)